MSSPSIPCSECGSSVLVFSTGLKHKGWCSLAEQVSSRERTIQVYKFGSDPEFLFARIAEWTPYVTPANQIITMNKSRGLSSFIGTDGHAATAELRPTPAHNIRRHLYDIASAIKDVEDYLASKSETRALKLIAQPLVQGEPLGGHIHATMFIKDDRLKQMQDLNRIWMPGAGVIKYSNDFPLVAVNEQQSQMIQEFSSLANAGKAFTTYKFGITMNYLLLPLELWAQPWPSRLARNNKYGPNAGDPVRFLTTPRPDIPRFASWAYHHFEYRVPSTWLYHPWLAYAYFALAKLTMINWDSIAHTAWKNARDKPQLPTDGLPANDVYYTQLTDRLNALSKSKTLIFTSDIKDLWKSLSVIQKRRAEWFVPGRAIDTAAWRSLL